MKASTITCERAFPTRHDSASGLRWRRFGALRNVSFELQRGEVLGIIGHKGRRLGSLLEVGTGFRTRPLLWLS
jgi:ABC-type polysaccharide/polyol phosphate transport system ATPase subunit